MRRGVDELASKLQELQPGSTRPIVIFARPAVGFYLGTRHRIASVRAAELVDLFRGRPIHARAILERKPGLDGRLSPELPEGWIVIDRISYKPGIVTRLDESPGSAFRHHEPGAMGRENFELLLIERVE